LKTLQTFKELNLPAPLAEALAKMNFETPTPVQAESIPPALQGKDILGSAQTGTGKTGAFGIPLLAKLYPNPGTKALILAPTRELAAQIFRVLGEMSEGMHLKGALLVGGESFFQQKKQVKSGADYYVCTPGRLIDHLDAGLKIPKVTMLVLDEVDRMLDMGFAPQLKQIVPHIPKERQTLLFSATLPKEILAVAATYLKDPVRVSIGAVSQPIDRVQQVSVQTSHINKNEQLLQHLKEIKGRVIIFARTQRRVDRVFSVLERNKYGVVSLHGGRTQGQRKEALSSFRTGSHPVMVATDLAGRGIDVQDIEAVINYDLPANREDYIHRIGRTARAGKTGLAYNYLTPIDNGGKDILTEPKSKSAGASALSRNKPNSEKGGWSRKGGKNRPTYQPRSASDGYNGEKRTSGIKKHFRKLPEGETLTGEEKPRPAFGEKRRFEKRPFKPRGEKRAFEGRDDRGPRREFQPRGERGGFGRKRSPQFDRDERPAPRGERRSFGGPRSFDGPRSSEGPRSFGKPRFGGPRSFGGDRRRESNFGGGSGGPRPFKPRRSFGEDQEFNPENRVTRGPRTTVFGGRKAAGPGAGARPRRPKKVIDIPKREPFRAKRRSRYDESGKEG